jgi:hypothetical protein
MRDGKKVKVPRVESSKTGTGFALNDPIDSGGRASQAVCRAGLVWKRRVYLEENQAFGTGLSP